MDVVTTIKSNMHTRPLFAVSDLPAGVAADWFSYVDADDYSARFFEYRGAWYDVHEFQVAPDGYKARGWDGVQPESYFSAVLVQWFDRDGAYRDDEIVVGYAHW